MISVTSKKTGRVFAIAVGALLAGLIAAQTAQAREFNASIWFSDSNPLTRHGYLEWAEDLKKKSAGNLVAKVFTGTVLLPPAAHLSGLSDGIVQVSYHAGTYTPSDIPLDNVLAQMSFAYTDYFVTAFAITDMNLTDPDMQKQWAGLNIVYGAGYSTIPYRLFCKKPVTTIDDLRGLKVRMPGAAHSDWAKSIGVIPVNVSSSEMYSGLEKGQLDCASNTMTDLRDRSLWEVSKHTSMVELGVYWAGYHHAFNRDFWRSLSKEERRTILDTLPATMVRTGIGAQAASDSVAAEAESHGVTFHKPSAELVSSIAKFSTEAKERAAAVGREKLGVDNPEALIDRFIERLEKWEALLKGVDRTDAAALEKLAKRELFDKIDVATYGLN